MSGFIKIAKSEFAFLEDEFGFKIVDVKEKRDAGSVRYVNREIGVGIRILYEVTSAFIFVFLYRLVDGEFRDNKLPIEKDTVINCFDLNDILGKDRKMRPAYEYGEDSLYFDPSEGLRNFAREFADRLKIEGRCILSGDFSVLPDVASIIKTRAKGGN